MERSHHCNGLIQLRTDAKLLDTAALRAHMFQRIDQDPLMSKFSDAARDMNQSINDLGKMVDAGMRGSIYGDFISAANKRADTIQGAMNKISGEDLNNLAKQIGDMSDALKRISDPTARRELEQRIQNYKSMHNMFNSGEILYPEVAPKNPDGTNRNTNAETRDMLKMVREGLKEGTLTNWIKENGPIIAATVVAIAATVAACATFGVSSPLAVGAWVAVAGLVAREGMKEVLFHINKDGYTGFGQYKQHGSEAGHWVREWPNRTPEDRAWTFLKDVAGKYTVEVVRDWVAFVATAGLANYFFGAKEAASATVQALAGAERAQLVQLAATSRQVSTMAAQAPSAAARTYLTDFLKNFGKELLVNSGFTVLQTGIEAPIHGAIGKEKMEALGEWGQFGLSFALSTGLAMGAGARHHLKQGKMLEGGKFQFELNPGVTREQFAGYMQKEGFVVRPAEGQPGRYEVLPINAKPGMKPIIMEEVNSAGKVNDAPITTTAKPGEALKVAQQESPVKIVGEPLLKPPGTELPPIPVDGKGKPTWNNQQIEQFTKTFGDSPETTQLLGALIRAGAPGDMVTKLGKDARPAMVELLKARETLNDALRDGKAHSNLTPEQWARVRDSVDGVFKADGAKDAAHFGRRMQQLNAILKGINETPATGEGQARAQALADLAGTVGKLPAGFEIHERFFKGDYPTENLQRLAELAKGAENVRAPEKSDQAGWDFAMKAMEAIQKDPTMADWTYVPTTKSGADFAGIDGVFMNVKTGEIRPIDYRRAGGSKDTAQIVDPADPFNFRPSNFGSDPIIKVVKDFLSRPAADHALTAEQAATIFGKGKSGLPDTRPETNPHKTAADVKAYLDSLQAYCKACTKAGVEVPSVVKVLTRKAESAQGFLEARAQLSHAVPDLITKGLAGEPPPKVQTDKDGTFVELPFNENFTATPKLERMYSDPPKQTDTYSSVRVYEDGRVVAVKAGEKGGTTELGNIRDLMHAARTKANAEFAADPVRLAQKQSQLIQQEAHINGLLGRKLGDAAQANGARVEITPPKLSPEFEAVHSPEQVAKMSRAIEEGTKNWADISQQAKRAEPYFKAEAQLRDMLAAEARRLEASGVKREDAARMAMEKASKGPDSPLRRAYDETARLRAANEPDVVAVEGRQRSLQSLMDRICANEGIPKVQIEVVRDLNTNRGEYTMGNGRIRVRMSDVLDPAGGRNLADTVQHEFAHHRQDVLIVQSIAQRLGTGYPPTAEQMTRIQAEYQKMTTSGLNEKFAKSILEKAPTRPLTDGEMARATELGKSFTKMAENGVIQRQLTDLKTAVDTHLKNLGESPTYAESLAKSINQMPAKARDALLGENPSATLLGLIEKAGKGKLTETDAANLTRLMDATLRNRSREIERRLEHCEKVYLENLHEAEAQELSRRVRDWQNDQGAPPKPPEPMPIKPVDNPQVTDAHRQALGDKLAAGLGEPQPKVAQEDVVARRQTVEQQLKALPENVSRGLKEMLDADGTVQQKADRLKLAEDILKMDPRLRKESIDTAFAAGKVNDSQLRLIVDQLAMVKSEPHPTKRAVNESKLPVDMRDALNNYLDKHPQREADVQRMLMVDEAFLREAGIDKLLSSNKEQSNLALRHAEALSKVKGADLAIQDGLNYLLKSPTEKNLRLVEDILQAQKLNDNAKALLKDPRFLDDPDIVQLLRRNVPSQEGRGDVKPVKSKVEITPEQRTRSIEDSFDGAATNLEGFNWSAAEVARAKRITTEILSKHMTGAEPVDVVCGSEQIGVVLRHADGSMTVLKMHRGSPEPWNPEWGRREHDAKRLEIGDSGKKLIKDPEKGNTWTVYQQHFMEQPTDAQIRRFINQNGITGKDIGPAEVNAGQFGRYKGRIYVLDYGAVN